jgi:hypothetical protein
MLVAVEVWQVVPRALLVVVAEVEQVEQQALQIPVVAVVVALMGLVKTAALALSYSKYPVYTRPQHQLD